MTGFQHEARLNLGEVDVAQREARQRLEQRPAALFHGEGDRRLVRNAFARREGFARQREESGHVGFVILNVLLENLHVVQLSRAPRSHRGDALQLVLRDVRGGACGVVDRLLDDAAVEFREVPVALRERLGMALRASDVLLRLTWERQQAVPHLEIHLADDVQAMIEDQIVVTVDGATKGVLEGEHRAVGGPLLGGLGKGGRIG